LNDYSDVTYTKNATTHQIRNSSISHKDLVEQIANDFNVHLIQILLINAVSKITSCTPARRLLSTLTFRTK